MDRGETKILLIVATELNENFSRLKSKGLSAMIVNWQSADPKDVANLNIRQGNWLKFQCHGGTRGNASQT